MIESAYCAVKYSSGSSEHSTVQRMAFVMSALTLHRAWFYRSDGRNEPRGQLFGFKLKWSGHKAMKGSNHSWLLSRVSFQGIFDLIAVVCVMRHSRALW